MMKTQCSPLLAAGLWIVGATIAFAQTVEQLQSAYSGVLAWNQSDAALRFTSSGDIVFTNAGLKSFIWDIPPEVRRVQIGKNVTVNGAFHSRASVMIAGEDRQTSVVYGTDEQRWSQNRSIKAFTICTFQNFGGVMTISNLTSLNPRRFHVRGWDNVIHAVSCDFPDRRGGHHNNSDGFEGGHIENPNGTLVSLREDSMTLRGAITNARITQELRG